MAVPHHFSQAALDRLVAELEDLTTRGRVDIADKIETARQHGDLRENAEYHAAKEEKAKMEARIAQLTRMLEDAIIVDDAETDRSVVAAGCVVSIRYEGDDDIERYLLGSIEERHDELDVVSPTSPLGEALIGAVVGHVVTYEAPGGMLKVEVVEISW
jgi:transcription elongation factor GreA